MIDNRFTHYKLDIELLDNDHYDLLLLTDQCKLEISKVPADTVTVITLLNLINTNLNIHFETEEAFMLGIKYPYIEHHKLAHKALSTNFNKLITNAATTGFYSKHTVNLLEDYVYGHVDSYDMQIKHFLTTL